MAWPELIDGSAAAVDRRRRIHVVPIDEHRPGDSRTVANRAEAAPSGRCALRTFNCCKSSICSRKFCSACTFTCQVRPNRLKSLTYSEPRYTCNVLNTSVIETPMVLAAVRSMSRYSQGVLARKLVNKSRIPGVVRCRGDDVIGHRLQRIEARIAAVFDHDLESAGGAQAFQRRRANTLTTPSVISVCNLVCKAAAIASRR